MVFVMRWVCSLIGKSDRVIIGESRDDDEIAYFSVRWKKLETWFSLPHQTPWTKTDKQSKNGNGPISWGSQPGVFG